jgi:peptidyl-dipeptidase Dcp
MKFSRLIGLGVLALMLGACGGADQDEASADAAEAETGAISVTEAELEGNPFLQEWDTPYGVPPFAEIENGHYMPAMKKAVLELRADVDAIANNPEAPTFENTIVAMETAGQLMDKVANTFGNVTGTDTDDELRALETEIYPACAGDRDLPDADA